MEKKKKETREKKKNTTKNKQTKKPRILPFDTCPLRQESFSDTKHICVTRRVYESVAVDLRELVVLSLAIVLS